MSSILMQGMIAAIKHESMSTF